MDEELNNVFQDESEDAILARIEEESLRYYNEVELPRRAAESRRKTEDCSDLVDEPHCSTNKDPSQVVTPLKDVFYQGTGDGAGGFHLAAGETYVYPTNYPVRKYQKSIIHSALFHNTLVSLPTGLGKTFIAAVVMYNYYRWFPQGKVVFMAPTRPLVAQQIRACHDIMAIPIKDTIEMTGNMSPVDRLLHWKSKRVFFLTPQVMANDLRSEVCPAKLFKCVVIDEAHRATKEYSYCQVIRELERAGAVFRVLALSATPGSNIKAVIEVVQNLRISTLELRGEDSPDVAPYTHDKQIEPISLNLSQNIIDFREKFFLIFERYARNLRESRLVTCNVQNITKFQLLKSSEKIRSRPPNGMTKARMGVLMSDFGVCMALAHGLDLLQTYGLRAFYQYFTVCEDEENRKGAFTRLSQDAEFHQLLNDLNNDLSSPQDKFWSHPKHENLVRILQDHFSQAEKQGEDTKVIIFCQYRVVVSEIHDLLHKIHPLIKPAMFIGQGVGKDKKGLPQKKQIEVMKQFRNGVSNVLIATCVAEEGLDIGSVDLLVLMEGQRSPVRLVQRLGRTGRHRSGRCVVLLTHGKEVQKFNEAMASRKSFLKTIKTSKVLSANLYKDEPSMLPPHLMPRLQLVHVNVPERITPGKTKKQRDIRQALISKLNDTKEDVESGFFSPEQVALLKEELNSLQIHYNKLTFTESEYLFHRMNEPAMSSEEVFKETFCQQSEFNDWNRVEQQTFLLSHSADTEMLSHLLKQSETMQLGQHEDINSQMNISSALYNKKKAIKRKAKTNTEKKVKGDKEERHGMDIRECMAFAADKARLTQDKRVVAEDCVVLDETVLQEKCIDLLSPIPSQSDQMDTSANYGLPNELDCPQCKDLFLVTRKFNNTLINNYQKISFTENDLTRVENLIQNLTKEVVDSINIPKIFSSNTGYSMKDIKDSINNQKQLIKSAFMDTSTFDVLGADEVAKTEYETRSYILPPCSPISIRVSKINNRLSPGKILSPNKKLENINDNFTGDYKLNFSLLEGKTKTSTPTSKKRPAINETPVEDWAKFISDRDIKSIGNVNRNIPPLNHEIVESVSPIKCSFPSTMTKDVSSNRPVFKIPQRKLNFETIQNPSSLLKSSKPVSPESPILSGQISSQNRASPPKLERKVLFCNDEKVNEKHFAQSDETEDNFEEDMLSVSQLFDEDSGEETKVENLDQSSMYTISQMVAKVSALTNTKKSMNLLSDQTAIENEDKTNHISFGNTDGDSLFDDINLDNFSTRQETFTSDKRIDTIKDVEKLQDFDSDSTDCDVFNDNVDVKLSIKENVKTTDRLEKSPHSTKSFNADLSCNSISKEITQLHESSFVTSRWLSCMKTPKQQPKLKTSTPLTLTRNELSGLSDSDSNQDVFQSPQAKKKSSKPITNHKIRKKVNKQKIQFVELEADVSGAPGSSDEENTSGLDDLDESFINDMTEQPSTSFNHTVLDMQAQYLQSVKSPLRKPGGYKIPVVSRSILAKDVFSQAVEQDDDSYVNDSFCCDSTEYESEGDPDPSLLEIAEQVLDRNKGQRRKKRTKRIECETSSDNKTLEFIPKKKRAFICSESSDERSEDELQDLKRIETRKRQLTSESSLEDEIKVNMQPKKKKRAHVLTSDSD